MQTFQQDPAFFFETCLKIRTKKDGLQPFTPKPHQTLVLNLVTALRNLNLPVRIIILKCRQIGSSTNAAGLMFHRSVLWPNQTGKVIAHKLDTTRHLFKMTRIFYEDMPADVKKLLGIDKPQNTGRKELSFPAPHRSQLDIDTAGQEAVGTGETIQNAHLSEVSKWSNPTEVAASFMQTVPSDAGMIIMESTANGSGDYFNGVWNVACEGKELLVEKIFADPSVKGITKALKEFNNDPEFIPLFFPWNIIEEYTSKLYEGEEEIFRSSLSNEELRMREEFKLTLGQLKWRRMKIRQLGQEADEKGIRPEDYFRQEYPLTPEEAFISTGQTVFDKTAVRALKPSAPKGRYFLTNTQPITWDEYRISHGGEGNFLPDLDQDNYGNLQVWEEPEEDAQYVIGGDTAGETGEDFCVLEVLKQNSDGSLKQVAEWHGKVDLDLFGRFAIQLGAWYNEALIAIESNYDSTPGREVRDSLYPNPYLMETLNPKALADQPTANFGFQTTTATKGPTVGVMVRHVREGTLELNSRGLIEEVKVYKRDERGRLTAPEGKHDDRVMACAIATKVADENPYLPPQPEHLQEVVDEDELKDVLSETLSDADESFDGM